MNKSLQQSAIDTIEQEAKALSELKNYINDSFDKAVEYIHNSGGRVAVTGIGKSAIIAQKIAATLNSTGTAALFMHAADAIHGDLGMIQKNDVVLILSKSGDSNEIKTLVPLIKSFGNSIIALVGNTNSFLSKNADVVLNTTVSGEACPNNLAPTTSSTAQMVMGDALAIALMKLNGFNGKDFARFHPGGNLGKRLYLKVDDIYKLNEKPFVTESTPFKNVIFEISKGRLGATVVLDSSNNIKGIITDGDIRRLFEKTDDIKKLTASDIVISNPKTILNDAYAVDALEKMNAFNINQLVVVNHQHQYLGIIHLHDLIREGII
jgi:arabinose-5-phosphate isomerase